MAGTSEEIDCLEHWSVDGRITLQSILKIQDKRMELDSSGSGHRPTMASYEHGNESSGSTEGRELLSWETVSFSSWIVHHEVI